MNRSKLKNYAPQARREFIQAVTDRAALFGLTKNKTEPITEQGDVAIIAGMAFPRSVADKRRLLEERIHRHGFEQVMEAVAYTWFNRMVAIRYMELHGYFDHGYRVLSHPEGKPTPEIVEHAEHVDLAGLNRNKVIELKLEGTKEAELYRMLLIAQCNALNKAMPFLFERIDDETELLLPDNLLHSDSIVRKLVTEIDEEDWQQVEIIGWLYQFYISEKKDQVIGKVVKSEDIPAATQLFTPNWIVKYLVQNSLGRQWLTTYPDSPLRGKMEYYIEPAEQTLEVQEQLKAITPGSLNPEELTLMDPACGSGHILVEAYDLLKEIYLERGYRLRDIPKLILTKNLFGLEIDDRAAQLAAFALMMKARADDRRIFDGDVQPNIMSIQESNTLDVDTIVQAFTDTKITNESDLGSGEFGFMTAMKTPLFAIENRTAVTVDEKIAADLKNLFALFENAKTFGSLIRVPVYLVKKLPELAAAVNRTMTDPNMAIHRAASIANRFLSQAFLLGGQYDAVVANPPYMGGGGMNTILKDFAKVEFCDSKSDLFAMFIERGFELAKKGFGSNAMVAMQSWMFLPSFEAMRGRILANKTILCMAHLGPRSFSTISGEVVQVSAFVCKNQNFPNFKVVFQRLIQGNEQEKSFNLKNKTCAIFRVSQNEFSDIPGSPIAYWLSEHVFHLFKSSAQIKDIAHPKQGSTIGNNDRFLRLWHEVSDFSTSIRWRRCAKGGEFRKWFGNILYVVNWENNGREIRESGRSYLRNEEYHFQEGIEWSRITSSSPAFRYMPQDVFCESASGSSFPDKPLANAVLGFLNTKISTYILSCLNPTLIYQSGDISRLPFIDAKVNHKIDAMVMFSKSDWDAHEFSCDFVSLQLFHIDYYHPTLDATYACLRTHWREITLEMQRLEIENNRIFIQAYGLQDELTSDVPEEEITLFANPKHRYGGNLSEDDLEKRFKEDTIKELLSYSFGCMMGRYSLDKPGLIYAHRGNEGFDPSQYSTFPADKDGIVPITDIDWFVDDAAHRFEEFISVAWPKKHLEENLSFVADSLGTRNGESPRDTVRRYFADDFFKDHLKTYKRRPIYWLFSSGKLGAFQFLVYLHRYNEGTLSRIRTEYVIPLQGKIAARLEQLGGKDGESGDIGSTASLAYRKRLRKEYELLKKQQVELLKFDEVLRHYADQRIKLDLDDGVKVNYGKFGDLLAEVKTVCGKKEDED